MQPERVPTYPIEREEPGQLRRRTFSIGSHRRLSMRLGIFWAVVMLSGLSCNALASSSGSNEPPVADDQSYSLEEALAVTPVDRRQSVLDLMGPPDAFKITFQELDGSIVRSEEWSYFDSLTRFDFIDGEMLWTVDLDPVPDASLYAHRYDPRDYVAYMSTAEVEDLLSDQILERTDLAEADIEAGLLMSGDQILLGFDDDRLVFVQTFILTPE